MDPHSLSIIGLLVLCLIPAVLGGAAGPIKGKAGLIGGPVSNPGDENFIYRLDRAHMNGVENLAPFAIAAVLAMMVGLGPVYLAVLVWLQVALRLAYSAVYIRGGAAGKGGNLRTVLFVAAAADLVVLIVSAAVAAL
jgi:uncharacterized MAPEG superfamily protein